jgi:hypothetical protein
MRALFFAASLLSVSSAAVLAQPAAPDGRTVLSPLPSPGVSEAARPSDYLRATQGALVAGRNGEAQQSLEMAQTRMLDRSVQLGRTNNPSDNPTVGQISQALQALAAGDRGSCLRFVQSAIESATAQGL